MQKVISGSLDAKSILALQWTFREKVMQPTASLQAGQRVRLTLVPWATREAELKTVNQQDDMTSLEPDRWFVEKAELLP